MGYQTVKSEDFQSAAKGAAENPGVYHTVEDGAQVQVMIDKVAATVGVGPGEADGYIVIVQLKSGDSVVAGNVDREHLGHALVDTAIRTNPEILQDLADMALAGLLEMTESEK